MRRVRDLVRLLPLLLVLSLAPMGCGGTDEVERRAAEARAEAEQIRADARRLRARAERLADSDNIRREADEISDRLRKRVERVLDDIKKSVPAASLPEPRSQGETKPSEVGRYLTEVITSVDAYWTTTLAESGLREPRVTFITIPPGSARTTGCGAVADDNAAFYCPADDTIYIAEELASDLWHGIRYDFPGQQAGYGRAVGDFGVAYVVAHEYAHNLQAELGFFESTRSATSRPFELQADCMAGLWGNSVYREGKIDESDVEEAMNTALAVGDFDYGNKQHHGTPDERRDAWVTGFKSGDPSVCQQFLQ